MLRERGLVECDGSDIVRGDCDKGCVGWLPIGDERGEDIHIHCTVGTGRTDRVEYDDVG